MNEEWPVFEDFDPILIQNYIRFETAARHIRNQEAGQTEMSATCRFQISPENYEKLKSCETSAPLLGLSIIMRDVAVKQSENCKIRYSKFIKVLD